MIKEKNLHKINTHWSESKNLLIIRIKNVLKQNENTNLNT